MSVFDLSEDVDWERGGRRDVAPGAQLGCRFDVMIGKGRGRRWVGAMGLAVSKALKPLPVARRLDDAQGRIEDLLYIQIGGVQQDRVRRGP